MRVLTQAINHIRYDTSKEPWDFFYLLGAGADDDVHTIHASLDWCYSQYVGCRRFLQGIRHVPATRASSMWQRMCVKI